MCRVLIDAGADLHTKNEDGRSPLHYACGSGELDIVKMLVEAGTGVRATDNKGCTCLMLAAYSGHTETVRYLVGLPDVDVNHLSAHTHTALQFAVDEGEVDVVQVLIDAGADINIQNDEGSSPLNTACASGALDVVKMLVEAGAGLRATDNKGHTCLILAARFRQTKIVRYLVGLPEVELNHRDTVKNFTALHYSVENEDTDVVRVLIDAGADIETRGNYGRSPLHSACVLGALDVVKILVRAGAGVRATNNKGHTCLILAVRFRQTKIVRYLVGLPEVELNHRDTEKNFTALHYAVENEDTDVVRVLIDAGADIETRGNYGRSPLHSACVLGALDVVKILVRAGAGVRATNNKGHTCLILAVRFRQTKIVRYLVGLPEVELNHRDTEKNYTALQYAVENNLTKIAQVLLDVLYLQFEAVNSRIAALEGMGRAI